MLRWQSRRAFAEAFAPAQETVGRQGLRLCRKPYPHNKRAYRHRNKIERMFCRLKDARRIATRYDSCANNFLSAVCLVALNLLLVKLSLDPRFKRTLLVHNSGATGFRICGDAFSFAAFRQDKCGGVSGLRSGEVILANRFRTAEEAKARADANIVEPE
jgi:hypothetical protein